MSKLDGDPEESAEPGAGRGVVDGAFALLGALRGEGGQARLTTLARRSGLPNATAHRLLQQLVAVGAVERRAASYALGAVLQELAAGWEPSPGLRAAASAPLRQLAGANASAALMVVRSDRVLVLKQADGAVDGAPLDPRAHAAALAKGLAGRTRTVARGQPDPERNCVAAAVDISHEPGLVAVAAFMPADAPVDRFAVAVAKIAAGIGPARQQLFR